jgi:hypothetical protein
MPFLYQLKTVIQNLTIRRKILYKGMALHKITEFYIHTVVYFFPNLTSKFLNTATLKSSGKTVNIHIKLVGMFMIFNCKNVTCP